MLVVNTIPVLKDNYTYLLTPDNWQNVAVVDPGDAAPVLAVLDDIKPPHLEIWCTHHHFDHVGGVSELKSAYPAAHVIGSRYDADKGRIAGLTTAVEVSTHWTLGGSRVHFLDTLGHTLGAITFCIEDAAFTGDTLFLAGCGRLFEGSYSMLYESLMRIASLPKSTNIYCGHEYAEANLRFARAVEPQNQHTLTRIAKIAALRSNSTPSVPATLEEEKFTNPFLRVNEPAVKASASVWAGKNLVTNVEVFEALRRWKDVF